MKTNSFRIKKRIQDYTYYGLVDLSAESLITRELIIEYSDLGVEPEWKTSIEFAAKYFYEHYLNITGKGLKIYVVNLHTMLADTSSLVVFYITVKCLSEIFEYNIDLIQIDQNTGQFVVLK